MNTHKEAGAEDGVSTQYRTSQPGMNFFAQANNFKSQEELVKIREHKGNRAAIIVSEQKEY